MSYNPDSFSEQTQMLLQNVFGLAARLEHGFIGSEHALWGVADSVSGASLVLKEYGFTAEFIEEYIKTHDSDASSTGGAQAVQFSKDMERVLDRADAESKELRSAKLEPEHLLLGILRERECAAAHLILSMDVDPDVILEKLLSDIRSPRWTSLGADTDEDKKSSKTLKRFSRNLTQQAKAGELDPMIGREQEVERIIQILSRRTKNNPVLVGESGVGKTAIAEGLAQLIADGRVAKNLAGKQILSLDMTSMVSGTRFRGDFEERIQAFFKEAVSSGNVILFLDEMHTLIGAGAGGDGTMDAANIIKPVLTRGDLQVIGATTLQEYRRYVERDTALERRFSPVMVEEPSVEDAVKIMMGLRERYESFHNITITDGAVRAAVEMSARYIQDRFLPDKAIDVMDEAAARIRTRILSVPPHLKELDDEIQKLSAEKKKAAGAQDYKLAMFYKDREDDLRRVLEARQDEWQQEQGKQVGTEDIAGVISAWTKIPVTMLTQEESRRLKDLEETLHKRVIGQDAAVTAVARAIRRGRTGIAEPDKPVGSFLFLGPTGVGKTELCRVLADVMFRDENAIIRLDMSEYMERHTVSKLIGSPPGYVGYDDGGQFTEQVRRKPYSIVLFDEIEKAHPDVWNMLLQIMEDGRLTDAHGRTVSFKNTIIVMTSNIGARDIMGKNAPGFTVSDSGSNSETRSIDDIKGRVMDELKKTMPPEFINRLDEIIVFHQLEREHILTIARNLTNRLIMRLSKQGVNLVVEESAIEVLADKGFDPAFGARPLRRTIQSLLESGIADRMVDDEYPPGGRIVAKGIFDASGKNGEIVFKIRKPRKA